MAAKTPRRVPVHLDILPFALPAPNLGLIYCTTCRGNLELHQPSLADPGRLIGVCGLCSQWFAIFVDPDATQAILVVIPGRESLLGVIGDQHAETDPTA